MTRHALSNLWIASDPGSLDAPPLDGDAQADLVIVGGGYTGVSAALCAAEAGARVRLIEARQIGHGGSGRNVGLVNAGLWLPPEEVIAGLGSKAGARLNRLLARAPALVFSLIERHGIDCEARRAGTLHCAHARRGMAELARRHAQLVAIGAPVKLLGPAEARARVGSDAIYGALFDPRAGTIQPRAYARGLAAAAQRAGAVLHEATPALSIRREENSWAVSTPHGTIRAGALLQATGGYLSHGLEAARQAHVPVAFFQVATAPLPADLRARILPGGEGCWDTAPVMSSWRLDRAGRLIVGGIGDLDLPGRGVHLSWARRKIARLFPAARRLPVEYAWSGRIAMTGDHLPRIIRIGPNALSCMGYSGRGIAPGTLFGARAARALLSGQERHLPVPAVPAHDEGWVAARHAFYEAGACLIHAVGARAPAR